MDGLVTCYLILINLVSVHEIEKHFKHFKHINLLNMINMISVITTIVSMIKNIDIAILLTLIITMITNIYARSLCNDPEFLEIINIELYTDKELIILGIPLYYKKLFKYYRT